MMKGLVFFLLAFLAIQPSWCRPKPIAADARKIVRAMDRNDDLLISTTEGCGEIMEEFDRWDRNNDCFLDEREVSIYIRKTNTFVPCFVGPCLPSFE